MRALLDPVVLIVGRLALAALLLQAALHKLRDVRAFRAALANYALLPTAAVDAATAVVVALELTLGVALLAGGGATLPGATGAALLLSLYTGAIALNLRRGRRHIDCGCTGPTRRQQLSGYLVLRNLTIAASAVTLGALAGTAPRQPRAVTWPDAGTIGAALITLALLYTAAETLAANAPGIAALARDHADMVAAVSRRQGEPHA